MNFWQFGLGHFTAKTIVDAESGPQVSQVVIDAIAERGEMTPATDGRISRTSR